MNVLSGSSTTKIAAKVRNRTLRLTGPTYEARVPSWSGAPERGCRVDAEDLDVGGEEGQLLEGVLEPRVVGMAVDLGEELGGGEVAADHVALPLGHAHAGGGEPAERLAERSRQVADVEDEAGDDRAAALLGRLEVARQHDETGGVVLLVLAVFAEHVEPVDLRGEGRRD